MNTECTCVTLPGFGIPLHTEISSGMLSWVTLWTGTGSAKTPKRTLSEKVPALARHFGLFKGKELWQDNCITFKIIKSNILLKHETMFDVTRILNSPKCISYHIPI